MRPQALAAAVVPLVACSLALSLQAQKSTEPRLGLQFTPPKGWLELPGDQDRHATLRLFVAPRAMASRATATHAPELRVLWFPKSRDDSKDDVGGLPRTTPFRSLEDFVHRGLGSNSVRNEVQRVGGVEGQLVTAKDIPGDHVLFGQTWPLDDGEAALCIEVLANQADKIKEEIDTTLGSLEVLPRKSERRVEVPWLADPDWAKKNTAVRNAARRKWAEERVAAAAKNPEAGFKVSKARYWTVLSAADAAFTKKAVGAAEIARDWLSKRLPEITKEAPLPAVMRVFDNVDTYTALQVVRGDSREYDSVRRELLVANDRDQGGPTGFGPVLRAVLWQIFDDVDPAVLPALPRWLDNGCREVLRSATFDGKKYEFAAGDVERGRIDYYRQKNLDMPALSDLIQEHIQVSSADGSLEKEWGYTPECSRLMRWFWFHDGQAAFNKPNLVSDYVKALAVAYDKSPNPVADVATVGLVEPQQKSRNTQYYKWRDALLVTTNNLVIPLEVEKWKAINEKWLAFNKNFK